LPEERGLYKQMKVREVIEYYAALKGMKRARKEADAWLERLGLGEHAHKRVAALSKGMSQKVQFIATVIAGPALVLLDEPFSGLDPVNAVVLREAILSLRKTSTIIFSTHDMAVAEEMCDAIFMIHRGRKVLDGTLAEIQDAYGTDTLRVRLGPDCDRDLATLPGVVDVADFGNVQELRLSPDANAQQILAELVRRGPVQLFEYKKPSLHEIFVRIARPELGHA
jgi:ABC-2 type transport system ATP-binding protein